jgi:hypothetical protein
MLSEVILCWYFEGSWNRTGVLHWQWVLMSVTVVLESVLDIVSVLYRTEQDMMHSLECTDSSQAEVTTWQLLNSCSIHLMNLWHCTTFYTGNGKCHQTKPNHANVPNVRPIIPTCNNFQTAIINMNFYVCYCTFQFNLDSDFCHLSRIITQQEFWNSPLLLWLVSVSSYVPYSVAPHPVHYVCVCCNARHTEQICTTQVTVFRSILYTYR